MKTLVNTFTIPFLGGMAGGVVSCGLLTLVLWHHGTLHLHRIEIAGDGANPAIAIGTNRSGGGEIVVYGLSHEPVAELGASVLQPLKDGKKFVTPYESIGKVGDRDSIVLTVDDEGKGIILMADKAMNARLVLGRIHWEDSAPRREEPELWGLQVSGNPGWKQKSSTVGLNVGDDSEEVVAPLVR